MHLDCQSWPTQNSVKLQGVADEAGLSLLARDQDLAFSIGSRDCNCRPACVCFFLL